MSFLTFDNRHSGPGFRISDFESNRIIGDKQFQGAQAVMNGARSPVTGKVRSVHVYMNMSSYKFKLTNGTEVSTCPAAMGYAFAGGTTDGPGALDFIQGANASMPQNPFWEIVKGELTTMAGRRIREAIRAKLISSGVLGSDAYVVVAGPANVYGHYVTTREEYSIQRYEGASTLFGQHSLDAYIDKYSSLVPFLSDSTPSGKPTSDAPPPEQTSKAISLQTGVVLDAAPIGKKFGGVLVDVKTTAYRAGEVVSAQFVGANPRNNLRLDGTFLTVDQLVDGQWKTVRSDSHPSTTYQWLRTNTVLGYSTVTISWTIESGTPAGIYRIKYFGDSKSFIGTISPFSGFSSNFTVA
ncbi:hypothetical protein H0H81_002188 [Sphagnurus paluster]|uniref:Neutral ceramidase n=1 Tax=Sphagnurus paluster TaxID=117069 RepID=A0A9P7GN60_9AGAR|nr:hypothetical protein H0H81_002188 [Sphagnurus paluster]